ncbi:MAG: hypothetical protein JXA22_01375 [Candidatus Thermoplasmatota archaeon]|nr:hypothetical protein [Candidatus Thermoplasmatota archaeon]
MTIIEMGYCGANCRTSKGRIDGSYKGCQRDVVTLNPSRSGRSLTRNAIPTGVK